MRGIVPPGRTVRFGHWLTQVTPTFASDGLTTSMGAKAKSSLSQRVPSNQVRAVVRREVLFGLAKPGRRTGARLGPVSVP
jgi:hypothetical protein